MMLDLPDGTVLLSGMGSTLWVYQPDGSPLPDGQPTVNKVRWNSNGSLHISGTLFNGICQGASYGDDAQMDSNYPLVRFTDGAGTVTYGTTYNWSSTSVQTGAKIVTTEAIVPSAILNAPGTYSLQVVANGNASNPLTFLSPVWVDANAPGPLYFGSFAQPYKTMATAVSGVPSGGVIFAKSPSSFNEQFANLGQTKAMTIIAYGGSITIGK